MCFVLPWSFVPLTLEWGNELFVLILHEGHHEGTGTNPGSPISCGYCVEQPSLQMQIERQLLIVKRMLPAAAKPFFSTPFFPVQRYEAWAEQESETRAGGVFSCWRAAIRHLRWAAVSSPALICTTHLHPGYGRPERPQRTITSHRRLRQQHRMFVQVNVKYVQLTGFLHWRWDNVCGFFFCFFVIHVLCKASLSQFKCNISYKYY